MTSLHVQYMHWLLIFTSSVSMYMYMVYIYVIADSCVQVTECCPITRQYT